MHVLSEKNAAAIAAEDFFISSDTAGINLHLRRKRLPRLETFLPEQTLLLMHGATFGSGSLFDCPSRRCIFHGPTGPERFRCLCALMSEGYGNSTWPPEAAKTTDPGTYPVRIETAIRDLGAAIDHILGQRRLDQVNLVAMSWGGSVAGAYTGKNNDKINRLALIAPLWLRQSAGRIDAGGQLPPYREVNLWKYQDSWRAAAPENQRAALIPSGWFDIWAETTLAIGPRGADRENAAQRPQVRYKIFVNTGLVTGLIMIQGKFACRFCSFMRNGMSMSPLIRHEIYSAG